MVKKKRNIWISFGLIGGFALFILLAQISNYEPGQKMFDTFINYSWSMLKFFPFVLILIGLFEVWVKRESIEKHLGEDSGIRGYFWAILLAASVTGPLLVALPVAHSLYKKGAALKVIFTYVGAAAICRIPMTLFEASYLGAKFTIVRFAVSLPLVILTAVILGRYLEKQKYAIQSGPSAK